jgi:hypothetical protein
MLATLPGTGAKMTLFHALPKAPAKGIETERISVGHHLLFKEGVNEVLKGQVRADQRSPA